MKQDTITADRSGIRLDKYLAEKFDDISRSQLQKYIKSGKILINGERCSPKYNVNYGDLIVIETPLIYPEDNTIEPQDIPLEIIFEDNDLIAVNKPAGLTVHPGVGNKNGTLVNALAYHFKELSDINGSQRPGIVHRLDQNTSGLILVAKNNTAHMKLAEQFSDRTVKKVYFGITWGKWQSMEGTIKESIGRKRNDPTTYQIDVNGRDSQTSYSVKNETVYFSEVNFLPKTGRTHQIRVHSAYLGHPLLGDDKYGGGMNKIKGYIPEITKKLSSLFGSVKRHILHAEKITFIHPNSNSEMVLNAEMPDDIQAVIKQINSLNV